MCHCTCPHKEKREREKSEERERNYSQLVSFVQFDLGAFLKANPHVIHKLTAHLNPSVSQGDKR